MSQPAIRPRRVLVVFAVFAAAHFLSYFFRSANAVLADSLIEDIGLTPAQLGLMSSVFFGAFALAQLPFGSALDRFGPRRTTALLMLAGVVGAVVFGTAQSVAGLAVGRALLGLGTAGILMGGLKALSLLLPERRFAAISGMLVAVGSSGALLATAPLAAVDRLFGWRVAFLGGGGLLLATAVGVAVWARTPAVPTVDVAARGRDQGFRTIFASGTFWRLACLALAQMGTMFAYQGLWAGPYLTDGAGFGPQTASNILLVLGIGLVLGFFVSGWLAQRFGVAETIAAATAVTILAQLALALLVGRIGAVPTGALFLLFSVSGSFVLLLYAQANALFPPHLTGRVVTAINLFMFLGGFALQWGLGLVVGRFPLALDGRAPAGAYLATFLATAGLCAVALLVYLPTLRQRGRAGRTAVG